MSNTIQDFTHDLDAVLFHFKPAGGGDRKYAAEDLQRNKWTLRDAVRGVQIFGGIGSGKSSGSGRTIAKAYLDHGFGGIVLTGKVDETPTWLNYIKEAGRMQDVVLFSPDPAQYFGQYPELRDRHESKIFRFNPLQYERERSGIGAGETRNIVNLFTSLAKMGSRASGEGSSGSGFWERAMRRCIQAAVNLLVLADKKITVTEIANIIRHTPLTGEPLHKFDYGKMEDLQSWANRYKTIAYLLQARDMVVQSQDEMQAMTFDVVKHYLLMEFQALAPETRSSILEHFYSLADPFRTGLLAKHFAGENSPEVLPENTFDGAIIILDFPVKEHLEVGIYAQTLYSKIWQQAVERRSVDGNTRPVFMWVDEAQNFINNELVMFQTTARSSRACTTLLSQNISNYYSYIGGSNAKEMTHSLLGNLATTILHNNNDHVMNEWGANTIGKDYKGKSSTNEQNITLTKELQYQFLPKNFSLLKTGGRENNGIVEAVVLCAGKRFANKKNYQVIKFDQDGSF